jgi:hypothetical protein
VQRNHIPKGNRSETRIPTFEDKLHSELCLRLEPV